MQQETWKFFPQILEKKINHLLDEAEPNQAKAYQLYKTCKNENLWNNSFEIFAIHLHDFFSLAKSERAKSYFDNFLDRPMERSIYESFDLTFRTATVNSQSLLNVANWSHEQMIHNCQTAQEESVVLSVDILTKTLHYITNPPLHEKDQQIEFEDFCQTWKKTVFLLFGKKYDSELETVLQQIRKLAFDLKQAEQKTLEKEKSPTFIPSIFLTQTEIDWTTAVREAIVHHLQAPDFPLSRGAEKPRLIELQKAAELYNLILQTSRTELRRHLDNVRTTILHKCDWLLTEKAR
ncbi:hypothetical protein [Pseudobdellovibrio exovorus]|uniref:Uncharacterized protein n=1 Tax=Pseudobdellovibrio exovorus JSS TaxID=1184267 RepID=M4VBD3_9BACT|nr:hypothetical protein [Pseudobdellovibrio exovorus]AGH95795.1 hypothetical protein A11Q_1579 [Pseudobdellovibrio exovorus JSS]